MSSSQKSSSLPGLLLRLLSQDWLALLPDLYRALRVWVKRYRHEGMYEIVDYDSTLELIDPRGETAIFMGRPCRSIAQNPLFLGVDRQAGWAYHSLE